MRRVLSEIFTRPKSVFQKYFQNSFNLDARTCPTDLIDELKDKRRVKIFITLMNEKEKSGFKILKKLTVLHLCLIYSADFCEVFKKINLKCASENVWLNENIIKPYCYFLGKLCHSQQMYRTVQVNGVVQFTFDSLFFVIKLIKDLMQCTKKLSSLFRYYKTQSATDYPFLLDNFVCLLACHAQKIYNVFKVITAEFIRFPKQFLTNPEAERIMKFIMEVELNQINQQMRELFLNSSFFPYGKGYGVKLLKIQDLPDQTRDYAESILYAEKPKRKTMRKKTLDSILFDKTGKLNPEIYQGLQNLTNGEEAIQKQQQLLQLQSKVNFNASIKIRDYSQHIQSV